MTIHEQLLTGAVFRYKSPDVNLYRISGDVIEVKQVRWFAVAVITCKERLKFKTISYLETPSWNSLIDLEKIELV